MTPAPQAEVENLRARVTELEAELAALTTKTGEALRESEEWQRLAVDAGDVGLWSWDIERDVITWSERIYDMHGIEPGAFGGTVADFQKLVHPDDAGRVAEAIADALNGKTEYLLEFRTVIPDGRTRWLTAHGRVIFNADRKPVRLLGALSDVTKRKLSEERFRALANTVPTFVWISDAQGKVIYLNDAWYAYTGLSEPESLGAGWLKAVHPDDIENSLEIRRNARAQKLPYEMELRYRRRDGEHRWYIARSVPMPDPETGALVWYGTSTDIEDYKRTESALRRSKADLEQFAYAAAHDLQEPLRMISIYSELLSRRYKGQLSADADTYIKHTTDGARRMHELVEDLLAYTRIVHSDDEPRFRVETSEVLKSALSNLRLQIEESAAEIQCDPLPAVRATDMRVLQLFQNLVGNALKYRNTAPPKIRISAARDGEFCVLSIRDNGIGINPVYHERIFGVFKRLHGREIAGTGIGLAICKRIVEQQGGRIWVESEGNGTGSTFQFTLPAAE